MPSGSGLEATGLGFEKAALPRPSRERVGGDFQFQEVLGPPFGQVSQSQPEEGPSTLVLAA